MRKVVVTCPPMLGLLDRFTGIAAEKDIELVPAKVKQTLSVGELLRIVPKYDGWIIGDDPATEQVFKKASEGKLRAAVKWGIGIDNVDFDACQRYGIPIVNTPNMFGGEVADVAMGYIIGLARQLFSIDRGIRLNSSWLKPAGLSLEGKTVAIVGFGDIGQSLNKRIKGFGMKSVVFDPFLSEEIKSEVDFSIWPERIDEVDFLVFTCSLNSSNRHMLNYDIFSKLKPSSFIINVARGPLVDENALLVALNENVIAGAALDVFEVEPLPEESGLRHHEQCIFGSHNGSNTVEGVVRASRKAISEISRLLDEK